MLAFIRYCYNALLGLSTRFFYLLFIYLYYVNVNVTYLFWINGLLFVAPSYSKFQAKTLNFGVSRLLNISGGTCCFHLLDQKDMIKNINSITISKGDKNSIDWLKLTERSREYLRFESLYHTLDKKLSSK